MTARLTMGRSDEMWCFSAENSVFRGVLSRKKQIRKAGVKGSSPFVGFHLGKDRSGHTARVERVWWLGPNEREAEHKAIVLLSDLRRLSR